jgi:glycosyltransferase involved in cell wall biosynthesis
MALIWRGYRKLVPVGQPPQGTGLRSPSYAVDSVADYSKRTKAAAEEKLVCMLCPGGFEHAGGIGRWAGYLFTAWTDRTSRVPLQMMDTRGFGSGLVGVAAFASVLGRLGWLLCNGRLGLIHANLSVRGSAWRKFIITELARYCGVPVILHLHSGRFVEFYDHLPALARPAVRRMFAHAAHVIVLGKVWEDAVSSHLGVPREKITVLFNAVAAPHPVRRPPAPDRICHIVLLGRLGPNKGVPELLQALSGDALRDLSWRVTLAGDGDLATYRTEAAALGIGDRIAFSGWLGAPAVSALLEDADIMVLPSHAENLSVAVIEALAHQVAVVTTPVGATSEIVTDNESALLIPVRDPLALAEALRRLIVCPELRERIATTGRQVFEDRLDVRQSAERLSRLYDMIMARTNSRDRGRA